MNEPIIKILLLPILAVSLIFLGIGTIFVELVRFLQGYGKDNWDRWYKN